MGMGLGLGLGMTHAAVAERQFSVASELPGADRGWWSMKDIVQADGSAIASVPARLGGVAAAQAIGSAKPTYTVGAINGLDAARFQNDDHLDADARAVGFSGQDIPFSWFGVLKFDTPTPAGQETGFSIGQGAGSRVIGMVANRVTSGAWVHYKIDSGTRNVISAQIIGGGRAAAYGVVYNGVTVDMWYNAVKIFSTPFTTLALTALTFYTIGARRRSTVDNFLNGYWCEQFDTAGFTVTNDAAYRASRYLMREWRVY